MAYYSIEKSADSISQARYKFNRSNCKRNNSQMKMLLQVVPGNDVGVTSV